MPPKSEVKGWGKVLSALHVEITDDMGKKAVVILKAELVASVKKNIAMRIGVMGMQIGNDAALREASVFLKSIQVRYEGGSLVVNWEGPEGFTSMVGGVTGAGWVHPSIKKGGYLERGLEIAKEKITAMLASEVSKSWASRL